MLKQIGIGLLVAVILFTAAFAGVSAAPLAGFDATQSAGSGGHSLTKPFDNSIRCITMNGQTVMCCWRTGTDTWRCEDQM